MRTKTLIFLLLACLSSCRISAEKAEIKPEAVAKTNKIVDVQPENSPLTVAVKSNSDIDTKLGTVDYSDERFKEAGKNFLCLTTQNTTLKSGDKIQIVLPEIPQKVFQGEIVEKLKEKCSRVSRIGKSSDVFSYLLKVSKEDELNVYYGIAVIDSPNQINVDKGLAHVDLDNDGKDEYFRECYGNESLHLFVWKGKPFAGKRIWYSYYYFEYDTPPSCKDKDFEGLQE